MEPSQGGTSCDCYRARACCWETIGFEIPGVQSAVSIVIAKTLCVDYIHVLKELCRRSIDVNIECLSLYGGLFRSLLVLLSAGNVTLSGIAFPNIGPTIGRQVIQVEQGTI